MKISTLVRVIMILVPGVFATTPLTAGPPDSRHDPSKTVGRAVPVNTESSLRLAIENLVTEFGTDYPDGPSYLKRLAALTRSDLPKGTRKKRLAALRSEALRHNPLLGVERLLILKRKRGQHGLPVNHMANSGIAQTGYDNEIAVLAPLARGGELKTIFRPPGSEFVGELDLHHEGNRLLFTMADGRGWRIHELVLEDRELRQVSRPAPDVDHFDACYLPDERIVFASTASFTAVPCWHGQKRACSLFLMNADGSGERQLCFDQDLDLHPSVLPSGQVIFNRWEYAGIFHMYAAPLMVMNPDGTGQKAVYGSSSYWPNRLYFPRGIPGRPGQIVAIATGYHGPPRMGVPVVLDLNRGSTGSEGLVRFLPGRRDFDDEVKIDTWYGKTWPKFLHPYPLAEPVTHRGAGNYFLVSMQPSRDAPWGIYLIDSFDNVVPILVDPKWDFFEPIPVQKTTRPRIVPNRIDESRSDAVIYLHDIYQGEGLADVPRGEIEKLRLVAYDFGFPGLAGPDKIGLGGPWDAMRILGTVPVHADGSAVFRVPANTPLSLQALDSEGKAVQLMRSWYTAMPGEAVSCVGCHEKAEDAPAVRFSEVIGRKPDEIEPWYGPPRGFDFEREVQPVLDRHCVSCHHGEADEGAVRPDLRGEEHRPEYGGHLLARLGAQRLNPETEAYFGGKQIKYTPAYEALIAYVRRVGIEDDVRVLVPGEYHADTSELIQMLSKNHHGVTLDAEAWDRLVTWIDLNAPCHGTWGDVAPIPADAGARRWEVQQKSGGPSVDFESVPGVAANSRPGAVPAPQDHAGRPPALEGWPVNTAEAKRRQRESETPVLRRIDLGEGVSMELARIPAGRFVMGDHHGEPDERPASVVRIDEPFWIGSCEVTNEQFRRFDPDYRSGYFTKRYPGADGPGLALDAPRQPAIRVSWQEAMAYCQWLSVQTGMESNLPTEAQWEYACRAGTSSALSYGGAETDFSKHANVADQALAISPPATGGLTSGIVNPYIKGEFNGIMLDSVFGGDIPCNGRFADGFTATAEVGRFLPNAWGLHDTHGNVAEWTRSTYRAYPYREDDGRNLTSPAGKKVLRGGSFRDRPHRCRSAFRLSYPSWQRVHNTGFRVVVMSGQERSRSR